MPDDTTIGDSSGGLALGGGAGGTGGGGIGTSGVGTSAPAPTASTFGGVAEGGAYRPTGSSFAAHYQGAEAGSASGNDTPASAAATVEPEAAPVIAAAEEPGAAAQGVTPPGEPASAFDVAADPRFQALEAELAALRGFAPVAQQMREAGYDSWEAYQADAARQQSEFQAREQARADDAAFADAERARLAELGFDQNEIEREVAGRLDLRQRERLANTVLNEIRARQEEQAMDAALQAAYASDPILSTFGADPATDTPPIAQQILEEYAILGATPDEVKQKGKYLAGRFTQAVEAARKQAAAEAVAGLKAHPAAPPVQGTGGSPAPSAVPNAGYRPTGTNFFANLG